MVSSGIAKPAGWYYRLGDFFKEIFGLPVYKIPLDAGFSCPNRDGSIGLEGCCYCYNPSFSPFSDGSSHHISIKEQLQKGKKKRGAAKYLAYFQAYSNTYAPVDKLKSLYDQALEDPEVVGLSIATRPDCVTEEIMSLLEYYAGRCHLWIEYGLQTCHNSTLQQINRGHDAASFARAVELTRGRGIYACAHIILGLPGETADMMLETVRFLNNCAVNGVKFHHLQVIKNTPLAEEYRQGHVLLFNQLSDYIPILCDCLEVLSPAIIVHRLATQAAAKELLIAPHWPESAGQIAAAAVAELRKRDSFQGSKQESRPVPDSG